MFGRQEEGGSAVFEGVAKKTKYMVYSRKYDRECRIGDLIDRETIERLDTHFEFRGYEDDASVKTGLEWSGSLDPRDGLAVTLLVDLSGSTHGRPIAQTCYAVLAATQALENLGASVEVLRHTTAETNRPSEEFNTDRTITDPGRLSEALFVVAKEPVVPAERAFGQILAMATNSPALLHENLDGEALVWAARRLVARPGQNRLLVLVTDGFQPICQASERFAQR
jgi:cobalamin biosynthesis protein CobT